MIDISIDTMGLSEEFELGKAEIDDLLELSISMVTKKFKQHWDDVAKTSLHSTRDQYRSAIEIGSRGRFIGIVYLNPAAKLANMIEMGSSTFDMKTGFLSSPKVKTGKSGPYITIPFRFAGAGSIGESSGFAGVLPADVMTEVKKSPEQPLPLSSIGKQHRMPKSQALRQRMGELKSKIGNLPMGGQTSKYEGVKRSSVGSGYTNFRRVSLNSDPMSWMHPGFEAKELANKALDMLDVGHVVDIALNNFLASL